MTSVSETTDRAPRAGQTAEVWTTRALFARHKMLGIGAVLALLLLLAIILGGILASSSVVVNDASACSTWSAANQTQQAAYARRYVRAHGPAPNGATAPASVVAAIDAGCNAAFANDVQDTVNVVQAIKNQ